MTEYKPWAGKNTGGFFWHDRAQFSERNRTPDELPTELFCRLRHLPPDTSSYQSRVYKTEAEAMADLQQAQQCGWRPAYHTCDNVWRFYDVSDHMSRDASDLPADVFARLRDGVRSRGGRRARDYQTEAAAMADLVRALIVGDTALTFYDPETGERHDLSSVAVKYLKALWS